MSDVIRIIGAETHNLKNISIDIPKNKLVVITGVSGSGKSSLAFDTLYAEGQKRYLESLSTYARMIVSDISDDIRVQEIVGLSPTIAINQKTVSNNPRSIVGTITEIYNYYRLLYSAIGIPHCPDHPQVALFRHSTRDVVEVVSKLSAGTRFHITFPLSGDESRLTGEEIIRHVSDLGFVRVEIEGKSLTLGDIPPEASYDRQTIAIIVDRLVAKDGEDVSFSSRLRDSLTLAFEKGKGIVSIHLLNTDDRQTFHQQATCPICGYMAHDFQLSHFSFNSHFGACENCHGLGVINSFSEEGIINQELTLAEGAILPWSQHPYYLALLDSLCTQYHIDQHVSYKTLSRTQKDQILYGVDKPLPVRFVTKGNEGQIHQTKYEGVIRNLERRFAEGGVNDRDGGYFQKRIAPYVVETECPTCHGYRLHRESLSVRVGGKNIGELCLFSVEESLDFFSRLILSDREQAITPLILKNIVDRLEFLHGVGLGYVTLARRANTLSGGESQRIRLATQIGTKLEGIIYVLDEPSIGLHPRDNHMLIENLKRLVTLGNTVVVVEHDEDIMRECDHIIDIGPAAGVHGGAVLFSGTYQEIIKDHESITGQYLSGARSITRAHTIRPQKQSITIRGARENNLKDITVSLPLGCLTVVTGVSGSGKSSLIIDILSRAALNHFNGSALSVGRCDRVEGLDALDKAIIIDQSPIGKTPHSNIATYTGVFTYIREVFSSSVEAQKRGYGPGRFSFNTKGGRCEVCEGSGTKKIEMHFLPDVFVECDICGGSRYNRETLAVSFKGKNISEVLNMTVEEATDFFASFPRIHRILSVLKDVGLGYITLGQSAPTLSGGEAQRIKLAFDLAKRSTGRTLYILDEPTTGLHFSDVQKLLDILDRLVEKGNSVVVIEHHLDLIAHADHIIDIGPTGGNAGGSLVFSGSVEKLLEHQTSYTAQALRDFLEHKPEGYRGKRNFDRA